MLKGFRFLKRIPLAKYVRLNLSKHGTGLSIGGRGSRISISPGKKVNIWLGIPGTGIGYRKQIDIDSILSLLGINRHNRGSGGK